MEEMKGKATPLLRGLSAQMVIELVVFADESLAIRKAGHTHSVWEPSEREDCLQTFIALTGPDRAHDFPLVVLLRKPSNTLVEQGIFMN